MMRSKRIRFQKRKSESISIASNANRNCEWRRSHTCVSILVRRSDAELHALGAAVALIFLNRRRGTRWGVLKWEKANDSAGNVGEALV
ncbi:hypothetical protein ACFXTH_040326 [Malus domestica]